MRRSNRSSGLFLCACLVTVMVCLVGMMQEDAQAPRTRNRNVRAARTVCATTAEAPGTQGRLLLVSKPPPPPNPLFSEIVQEFFDRNRISRDLWRSGNRCRDDARSRYQRNQRRRKIQKEERGERKCNACTWRRCNVMAGESESQEIWSLWCTTEPIAIREWFGCFLHDIFIDCTRHQPRRNERNRDGSNPIYVSAIYISAINTENRSHDRPT